MPRLVLGPMLRYVDQRSATVWVEADTPCTVEVLGSSARTFHVSGHHYALVALRDLKSGTQTPYTVSVDGEQVWPPPDGRFPPSLIRTTGPDGRFRLVFGSCRVTASHDRPAHRRVHRRDLGVDALRALATRMSRTPSHRWPDQLLMLGDQVYADQVSPHTLQFIRSRRDTRLPPGEEIADFEEYARLYREAWSEPVLRWLFSTLPSAMIFDDHDVHDDWNTSAAWRRAIQATSWWQERVAGGLAAYWLYQHLGNLSPDEIDNDGMLDRLRAASDGGPLLLDYALRADSEIDGRNGLPGIRWSYRRDYGGIRLLVVDSRCGRVLESGHRRMVDDEEWAWIYEQTRGNVDHLLIASSLPVLLPPAIHDVEAWNEALCDGANGSRLAALGERLRQSADLEHWAAFRASFDALTGLVAEVAGRPAPPAMICFLSGDVHFSYLAEVTGTAPASDASRIFQAVCSPIRNPIQRRVRLIDRFTATNLGQRLARALARSARVPGPAMHWQLSNGPWFRNSIATLELAGRTAQLTLESAVTGADDADSMLKTVYSVQLS